MYSTPVSLFISVFFAYLDPGSGSFILQILIAGFLGFLLSAKIFWARILAFFSGSKPAEMQETDENGDHAA